MKQQSGFSLVETLVAITILLIVVVGPMTILSTTSNSSSFASEQVTAFFLAQEGVELAQLARDNLVLRRFIDTTDSQYLANPWDQFTDLSGSNPYFANGCYNSSGCGLYFNPSDYDQILITDCSTGDECQIYAEESGVSRSRFTHEPAGNTETIYTREVFFEDLGAEVRVRSTVEWFPSNARDPQRVTVETFLIDVYGS